MESFRGFYTYLEEEQLELVLACGSSLHGGVQLVYRSAQSILLAEVIQDLQHAQFFYSTSSVKLEWNQLIAIKQHPANCQCSRDKINHKSKHTHKWTINFLCHISEVFVWWRLKKKNEVEWTWSRKAEGCKAISILSYSSLNEDLILDVVWCP